MGWVSVLFVNVASASTSATCQIEPSSLRACQGGNQLAPKHYPASIVFLPIRARQYDSVKLILKGLDEDRSATRVALDPNILERLREEASADAEMAKLLQTYTVDTGKNEHWEVSSFPSSGSYVRDTVVYTVNQTNGAIQIQQGTTDPANVSRKGVSELCGRPIERLAAKSSGGNSDRGGNIMALPGGACLTAKGATAAYVESICGPNAKRVELEPDFSKIKHVDEIVNIVPRPGVPPPCDFAVLMASPKKMKDVLRQNPKGSFFPADSLDRIKRAEGSCSGDSCDNPITTICDALQNMIELERVQNEFLKSNASGPKGRGGGAGDSGRASRGFGKLQGKPNRIPAAAIGLDGGDWRSELEKDEREKFPFLFPQGADSVVECSRFRNEDVAKLLEMRKNGPMADLEAWVMKTEDAWIKENNEKHKDKFATYERHDVSVRSKVSKIRQKLNALDRFSSASDELQARQDRNWEKIKRSLPKECQSDSLRVDLPAAPGGGGSLNPNPTNLQIVGQTAIYPEQFNPAVAKEIESSLKALGLKPLPINSFKEHVNGGNIHCLSNEIRLCRP